MLCNTDHLSLPLKSIIFLWVDFKNPPRPSHKTVLAPTRYCFRGTDSHYFFNQWLIFSRAWCFFTQVSSDANTIQSNQTFLRKTCLLPTTAQWAVIWQSRGDHRYSDYFLNMAGIGICEVLGATRCSMVHVSSFTSRSEFILSFLFLKCFFVPNSQWKEKLRDMVVVETTQLLYGDDRRFHPQTGCCQEKTEWWWQHLAGGAGLSNSTEVWALLDILWIHAFLLKKKNVLSGKRTVWQSVLDSNLASNSALPPKKFPGQLTQPPWPGFAPSINWEWHLPSRVPVGTERQHMKMTST